MDLESGGLYYSCSENKGADQLRSHCAADVPLFSHIQNVGFFMTRLNYIFQPSRLGLSTVWKLLDEAGPARVAPSWGRIVKNLCSGDLVYPWIEK